MAFAALKERAQRLNRALAGHRFLFGSVEVGASALDLAAALVDRARAGAARAAARRRRRPGASSSSPPRSRPGSTASGVLGRDDAAAPRRGRSRRPRGRGAAGHPRRQPAALVRLVFRRGASRPAPRATSPPGSRCGRSSWSRSSATARRAARRPDRAPTRRARLARPRRVGVARVESPRGRDGLRRRAGDGRVAAPAPAHRLLRQLAGAGARRRRATSCPTSR